MISKNFLKIPKLPIIGIGPMSKNCVDASIEFSNENNFPLMLIASRRQIESNELGRGYVNNWSTEEFSTYVLKKDKKKKIILCRDHGGPWQNDRDKKQKLNLKNAMNSAKKSFKADIDNNFKIIHIDPSENLEQEISIDKMLERIYELYNFCCTVAKENKKEVSFEISIGKEDGGVHDIEEIKYAISKMEYFCAEKNLPKPMFIVIKTGNYVMETKNIGVFEEIIKGQRPNDEQNIKKIINFCNSKKIMIKEHNADYISEEALSSHTDIGIHAINVAPEFGVTETKAILKWLSDNNFEEIKGKFLDTAFESNKWKKWIIANSNATKNDKSIISGHYIFSKDKFQRMINNIEGQEKFNLYVKDAIEKNILKYLKCLKLNFS